MKLSEKFRSITEMAQVIDIPNTNFRIDVFGNEGDNDFKPPHFHINTKDRNPKTIYRIPIPKSGEFDDLVFQDMDGSKIPSKLTKAIISVLKKSGGKVKSNNFDRIIDFWNSMNPDNKIIFKE